MTETPKPTSGVLLRARNGDVIGFDETGLRMNLSDQVISDIGQRLPSVAQSGPIDPSVLGDIQAWDVQADQDWYLFTARLPGEQGVGRFRRRIEPVGDTAPDIFADPNGALFALLSLGGTRRGATCDDPLRFPFHLVTTGDDLGPAGAAGTLEVALSEDVQRPFEQTLDTQIADELIGRRQAEYRALPLIYARSETDNSSSMSDFVNGKAVRNFEKTVENLCAAAKSMNVPAKVLAVGLEFTLEAVREDGVVWRDGIYQIMEKITDIFANHGLRKPLFVTRFDAGICQLSDDPVLRAQWELTWNTAGHDLVFSAPGYMFAQDAFGRPTNTARQQIAEMEACAIEACNADEKWSCPVLLLAEREEDRSVIRCRGQGLGGFVIDADDPLGAGAGCGFQLDGCDNAAKIINVKIDEADQNDILITFDKVPEGKELTLLYALGHPPSSDGMTANRGTLRDEWSRPSRTGVTLHRWALPAALPVH